MRSGVWNAWGSWFGFSTRKEYCGQDYGDRRNGCGSGALKRVRLRLRLGAGATLPFEVGGARRIKGEMLTLPTLLANGGWMLWLILLTSAVAMVVFIERFLHFHRAQINSIEFLNGVRTVLKRENVVEALSICDATPGPVPRLVKTAILNRERGRDGVREALEEAGVVEVPRLEEKLNVLATIAQ